MKWDQTKKLSSSGGKLWLGTAGGGGTVTLSELVHATSGVDEAGLTSEEGVAACADTNLQVFDGGEGLINSTASAGDGRCEGVGVDGVFHEGKNHEKLTRQSMAAFVREWGREE